MISLHGLKNWYYVNVKNHITKRRILKKAVTILTSRPDFIAIDVGRYQEALDHKDLLRDFKNGDVLNDTENFQELIHGINRVSMFVKFLRPRTYEEVSRFIAVAVTLNVIKFDLKTKTFTVEK